MTLCSEVVIDMYRSSFVPMYRSGTPRCSEMVMYRSGPNPYIHIFSSPTASVLNKFSSVW